MITLYLQSFLSFISHVEKFRLVIRKFCCYKYVPSSSNLYNKQQDRPKIRHRGWCSSGPGQIHCRSLRKIHQRKGSFNVVLSGGSLIDTMRYLARAPYKESVDWPKWSIFWLDERVVPLDSKDSNYRLAWDALLKYVTSY
ncbi:unnamed protein product [Coffea canephora]|uniref:DH200=94 genomic scaffold, scaffold_1353 n=1 Tax=Coffea canephora TaxID=49390 RepID=A0A068VLJ9_COFCA|nr:unnamed protein product [Coffea canephora]